MSDDQLYKDIDELLRTVKSAADAAILDISMRRPSDALLGCRAPAPLPGWPVLTTRRAQARHMGCHLAEGPGLGDSRGKADRRVTVAAAMQSPTMRASMGLWWRLKPRLLKPLFEAGESEGEGARRVKRARVVD